MTCDCCCRQVDYVRASFWLGDARLCRECLAQWCDPDNDQVDTANAASIGNFVRLKHGLPPLAAALALSLALVASTAQASRHCLDHAEAARTWPTRLLAKDGDGCWTYDRHPPQAAALASMPDTVIPVREPMLMDRWPNENLLSVELRELEPGPVSRTEPSVAGQHIALLVSLVLATLSVITVATGWKGATRVRPDLWPRQRVPSRFTNPVDGAGRPIRRSLRAMNSG